MVPDISMYGDPITGMLMGQTPRSSVGADVRVDFNNDINDKKRTHTTVRTFDLSGLANPPRGATTP